MILEKKFLSTIFTGEEKIPFHKQRLPEFDLFKKYTVLGIIHLDSKFLLIKKENGFYAIPGGGSEEPKKNSIMFQKALENVNCPEILTNVIVESIDQNMSYAPAVQCSKELLEETGTFSSRPEYLGHQKTLKWRDELVFVCNKISRFTPHGKIEVNDLQELYQSRFIPIGKSINKQIPYRVFTTKELINALPKVVYSHQVILAHYLLSIIGNDREVFFHEDKIKNYL